MDTLGNIIDRDSLPDVIINDIAEDIEKNLVIGSESGVFHLQSYAFRNYDWKSGMPRYVWSIFEDRDSSIVFATYHGLLFRMKDNKLSEVEGYRKQLMANEVFYMGGFSNSLGQWMIPTNYRIFVYDHGKISFIPLIHKGNFSTCLATYEDKAAQKVYFGTTNGLFIYELSGGKTTHVDTEGRTVLSIEKDRHGHLWICTGKKVLLLENDTVFHGGHDESPVNTGVVSCCMDSAGNMWYVTREGLNFYNYKNHISIADGHYYFITLWQNRKIIAGGVEGVTVIDLEKFYKLDITGIQQFDRFNGFTGIECGQNGTCVDTKGNVWIPASESVVKFRPDRVTYDTIPPEPYVVSFECSRKNLVWREQLIPIRDRKYSFELQPGLSNIRIIYDGLDYSSRERIKFRYRLVGYSDIWKETSRGEAVFTNLSPGWYSFELQSANENGYWSKIPRVIEFRIRPYFYQTFGFRLAVLILSVSLIVFLIILYFRRLQKRTAKEKEVEKKLVAMQVKTINAQLDPHFIFNTITAIGSEVQEKNNDKAYAYFVKVSQLLRQSIKITNRITRPLTEEIEFVKNYLSLQKFRFDDRFEYMFNISSDVDLHTDVPKMCLQIFVENAMKHGIEQLSSGGRLLIVITRSNNGIRFIIEDNGIGREASARNGNNSTGVGLLVFKEFFDIMNQYNTHEAGFTVHDLYENGFASGTRVELFIPDDYQYPVQ
ncbi:hypothetical protein SDC9_61127 [bioreactor metagenome]|uniref:Signal transduction histidine kinase internal region domain-containing protein n=1 Tax=bioreactor metagenome TaxID=1076179 RepID=A0A644XKK8_9ZZZZ